MATIQEVAKLAELSVGTVSKYLNGEKVKANNEIKIRDAITALNYKQNFSAKSLKSKRNYAIGLLLADINNVFNSTIAKYLENEFEKIGYTTLIVDYGGLLATLEKKVDFLLSRGVDGLVLFLSEQEVSGLDYLKDLDVPLIVIDNPLPFENVDSIIVNNRESSCAVVGSMLERGHRRIGIIAAPTDTFVGQERLAGCLDAYALKEQDYNDADLIYGDYSKESGYLGMKHLLEENEITAVFVCNYYMALGAMKAIFEFRKTIGTDISFASFDDFEFSDVITPRITVIRQPVEQIAKTVINCMKERFESNGAVIEGRQHILSTEFSISDSIERL